MNWSCEMAEHAGWGKSLVRTKVFADLLAVKIKNTRPIAVADNDLRLKIRKTVLGKKEPLIVFQTSAATYDRPLALFAARGLARAIHKETGAMIAIVGWQVPAEFDNGPWINLSGKLSITDLKALIAEADLVVALDSGVSWLGVALKRPTIVLFTTIPTEARVDPDWTGVKVIRLDKHVGCSPC